MSQYDSNSGQLLFHRKNDNGDGFCEVYEDDKGSMIIHNEANLAKETQLNLDIKNATYREKQHRYFDSSVREGWRVIARIPMWYFAQHPEIRYDDKELERTIEKYPMWKAIDVSWNGTTPSKGLVSGGLG